MPASAFALALGAAVLHATWNALLARARDVRAATTLALLVAVLLLAPLAIATWDVDAAAAPWIVASGALEVAYFVLLTAAYQRSDLSLVYPIARGSAPILVLVGAALVGVTLGVWQGAGVVLVGFGVMLVRGVRGAADGRGVALSVVIGVTIAGYTLVDKEGIEHAATLPYLELVLLPVAIVTLSVQIARRDLGRLRAELGWPALVAGVLSFAAYALVLAALELAPAASVAAIRETSILFAVGLGALVLHERVNASRLAGATLVVVGVGLVALA
jgi:drug/metabolite transporter (DMT)-like permease